MKNKIKFNYTNNMRIKLAKAFIIILGITLSTSIAMPSLYAYANSVDKLTYGYTKIYTGNHDSQQPVRRTRGNCTDVYSKTWCNAHGYGNNRPVGARVTLTQREKDCLFRYYIVAGNIVIAGVTKSASGIWTATANAAYTLWVCSR